MLTTKNFKDKVIDLGYFIDEQDNEFKILKLSKSDSYQSFQTGIVYAIVGIDEQYSTTFKNTPNNLKKLVRQYEDTAIKDRTGLYMIPLKNLDLGGQQYLTFNKTKEKFNAMDKISFTDGDLTQTFTKEELESDFFKEQIGDYLQWAVEA